VKSDIARIKFGDFNGDGRTDIARINDSGQPMTICLSNCISSSSCPFSCLNIGPTFYVNPIFHKLTDISRVKIGDYNGDGKIDLARVNGTDDTDPMTI